MISGPDGHVYVGATAGYGQLEGPLLAWDGTPDSVRLYGNLVHDQSVISLAIWKDFIIGGTTTTGGGGSHPTQTDARIFLWNTHTHTKEFDLVPVPGAEAITDLITSKSGLLYGIAEGRDSHTLFAFNPLTRAVISTHLLPFHNIIYNAVGFWPDGAIVGLAEEGIFTIDEIAHEAHLIARSPVKITGGFDIRDDAIYFISNSEVFRYRREAAHAR
jgi:hypothetical protein